MELIDTCSILSRIIAELTKKGIDMSVNSIYYQKMHSNYWLSTTVLECMELIDTCSILSRIIAELTKKGIDMSVNSIYY